MNVLVYILKLNAILIYFFLKLLPIKEKVVFISRFSKTISVDFLLLTKELKRVKPDTEIVVLNHKIRNRFSHIFEILIEMYHLATAKTAIIDSYIIPVSILKHKDSLLIIQLWHSVGSIKQFGYDVIDKIEGSKKELATAMQMHRNYSYVICGSKACVPYFSSAFKIDESKIKVYGLPRIDFLLDKKQQAITKKQISEYYHLNNHKKTILYAPTFRKTVAIDIMEILQYINLKKYNFIFKIHPSDVYLIKDIPDIIIDEQYEAIELLAVTDYLITDYSGIAFEAAVLDIPTYYDLRDINDYQRNRGLYIDLKAELSNNVYENPSELVKALENHQYDYQQLAKFKKKYLNIRDGTSTQKIISLLER